MPGGTLPPEEQIRVAPGILDASCSAEQAQRFVGRTADEDTVQAAISASGAKTARVIKPDGALLHERNISEALSLRNLMTDLRSADPFRQGGGRAFAKSDRSRFLDVLDREIRAVRPTP